MKRETVWSLLTVGALASVTTLGVQELTRTFVINLKDPHPIVGTVEVPEPIPHSRMHRMTDMIVSPASRTETNLWTEVGLVETDGFTSVVLSLQGELRGSPSGEGVVALVLLPEEESVQRSFAEGEVHLELEAVADPVPGEGLYFSGSSPSLAIAFPRYRAYLYNTTNRSAAVNVYAYLTN
jgi:hypothetical protein